MSRSTYSRRLLAPVTRVAFEDDGTLRPNALLNGILVMRWGVLAWMVVLVSSGVADVDGRIGWAAFAVALAWTAYLTWGRSRWSTTVLVVDLVVAAGLLVLAAVAPPLATIYPVTAALTWGARRGFVAGAAAGAVLGSVLVTAHVVQGLVIMVDDAEPLAVLGSGLNLVLAGGGIGLVSTLIQRSARAVRTAQGAEVRAREEAARAAEREQLGRRIHDSVLQSLALVHKRGRELAHADAVPGSEVAALADLAAEQERSLRDLIVRAPAAAPPDGSASLRDRVERAARSRADLDVAVGAAGDVVLAAAVVEEIGAAVDEALANVAEHAGTRRAWILVEATGPEVVVAVRDDGCGFRLDEAALRAGGRLGLLGSIRGRVEDLGGRVTVDSAPGRGTEVEMHVPVPGGAER